MSKKKNRNKGTQVAVKTNQKNNNVPLNYAVLLQKVTLDYHGFFCELSSKDQWSYTLVGFYNSYDEAEQASRDKIKEDLNNKLIIVQTMKQVYVDAPVVIAALEQASESDIEDVEQEDEFIIEG